MFPYLRQTIPTFADFLSGLGLSLFLFGLALVVGALS